MLKLPSSQVPALSLQFWPCPSLVSAENQRKLPLLNCGSPTLQSQACLAFSSLFYNDAAQHYLPTLRQGSRNFPKVTANHVPAVLETEPSWGMRWGCL